MGADALDESMNVGGKCMASPFLITSVVFPSLTLKCHECCRFYGLAIFSCCWSPSTTLISTSQPSVLQLPWALQSKAGCWGLAQMSWMLLWTIKLSFCSPGVNCMSLFCWISQKKVSQQIEMGKRTCQLSGEEWKCHVHKLIDISKYRGKLQLKSCTY